MDCPPTMKGVKMAKEIKKACAVDIPTVDFQTPDRLNALPGPEQGPRPDAGRGAPLRRLHGRQGADRAVLGGPGESLRGEEAGRVRAGALLRACRGDGGAVCVRQEVHDYAAHEAEDEEASSVVVAAVLEDEPDPDAPEHGVEGRTSGWRH